MTEIALYADDIRDLSALLAEINGSPDNFRTLDVHIELAHKGMLFVYETKKAKGQTDSIYYARMAKTGANKQLSQQTAYDAVSAFLGHGQFAALTGEDGLPAATEDHPSCTIAITYRRTGMPEKRSMRMIFLGFADDAAALAYAETADNVSALVRIRPFASARVWEWK